MERLRRHWLSSPSASLSHLENLRQKRLAVPPAQVAQPRLRREGGRAHPAPFPSGARPPAPGRPHPLPGLPRLAPLPTRTPPGRPDHPPAFQISFRKLRSPSREEGREAEAAAPPCPRWRRPNQRGNGEMLDDPHAGLRFHSLNSTLTGPPPDMPDPPHPPP